MSADANYEGCDCGGEHRTTGGRAWCLDCSEWCYPGDGMQCEVTVLRSENSQLKQALHDMSMALAIAQQSAPGSEAPITPIRSTEENHA